MHLNGQPQSTGHLLAEKASKADFELVRKGHVSELLMDPEDHKTVLLTGRLFADDLERVSGLRTVLRNSPESVLSTCVILSKGKSNVMDNLMTVESKHLLKSEGQHTLKIWMVDPGMVIDKIVIHSEGLRKSYLGPPESFYNR